jgi:hypothetical protein
MSPLHLTALLALSIVALPSSTAVAQVIFGPGMQGGPDRANEGRATERGDIYHCQGAPGGSRVRENCEVETTTVRIEQEIKLAIKLAPPPSVLQCGASTTTAFQQRDTIARVSSTLEIRDCTVASGAFTVAMLVKDENGQDKPLEFSETWQRSDEQDVQFTADYPIGENMELLEVRLQGLKCTCGDPATAGDEVGGIALAPEQPATEN